MKRAKEREKGELWEDREEKRRGKQKQGERQRDGEGALRLNDLDIQE